jgi:SAM-dependent methyltransferase
MESTGPGRTNGTANKLLAADEPFHDWYRFVLSYPPHLVRDYAERFELTNGCVVLDPFCGTGTTVVEAKKLGIAGVGIEATPVSYLASSVKTDWDLDADELLSHAEAVADQALGVLLSQGLAEPLSEPPSDLELRRLPEDSEKILLKGSISPLPLHRVLVLLSALESNDVPRLRSHELLALARILPTGAGNLRFGPEVGVGKQKVDVDVVGLWLDAVRAMARDLRTVANQPHPPTSIIHGDARERHEGIPSGSVDAVITSPPYPNEKDYTRTTRLEAVILGLVNSRLELRQSKELLLRSNTRNVYKADDDDQWVSHNADVQAIADQIESRRIELGKTSGFERLYPRATKLYFGGMARHLQELRRVLKPGARLAYVVGDQASYLRVMIRTGELLAGIATELGYEVESIDLFRTRIATATGEQLREEALVLKWPRRGDQ